MRTRNTEQLLVAIAVPGFAGLGVLGGATIFSSRLPLLAHTATADIWLETLAAGLTALICGFLLLWWLAAVFVSLVLGLAARSRGQGSVRLPSWVPTVIKGTVTGFLGISVLAMPSFASPTAPVHPTFSTSAHQITSGDAVAITPDTYAEDGPEVSPFLPSGEMAHERLKTVPTTELTATQTQRYTPISPLFGRAPAPEASVVEAPQEAENQQVSLTEQDGSTLYTVQAGDTLWSIAESLLPASASGADVLNLVKTIQETNAQQIPQLETTIFPGQQLSLPPTNR